MAASTPWYADGLRFECTQCGNCCGGEPGNVYISDAEVVALAERLGLDEAGFRRRYTRTVHRRREQQTSLIELKNHDCVFYDRQRGCTVYEDRPLQCRTWPFWRSNIASREDWAEIASDCPGVGRGELFDIDHIERTAAEDGLP